MTDLDTLAEAARNRGLRLARSRVRTPGKRRFGKAGLADAKGKPVFGMDSKGPIATPEEVEDYLRNLEARDWGESLGEPVRPRKKAKASRPAPPPPAKPVPKVRDAKTGDSRSLVALMKLLDHDVDEPGVRKRIGQLARDKLTPLVATLGKQIVGLCGIGRMVAIHRDEPVGRINILVVAEDARGEGVGRLLVEEAERRLKKLGCVMVEITSNDRLTAAHAFYRHLGYERTSLRFAKIL